MSEVFVSKKELREYAEYLLNEISTEEVMEFVQNHIHEDLYLGFGKDKKNQECVRISCFMDYDEDLAVLYENIKSANRR